MRALCALWLALSAAACAKAPNLEQAIAVHNTLRQIVLDSDVAFSAVYSTVEPAISSETHGDDAAYAKALAPYKAVATALTTAKQSENVLYAALNQWQAGKLDDGLVRSAYACAADALSSLKDASGSMPAGAALHSAAFALQLELQIVADGASCKAPGVSK